MNASVTGARKALLAGRELEKNLPVYLKGVAGAYFGMANYNLAMQYTTFSQAVAGHEILLDEREEYYVGELSDLIMGYLSENVSPQFYEDGIKKLFSLRERLCADMQAVTDFSDKLYLHEYVMKRLAPKMETGVEEFDEKAATQELMAFLFEESRKESLRENISFLISELPLRMTRARFFAWVRSSAAAFRELDAEGLNRTFYMLYSAAGLMEPEGRERFPELGAVLAFFDALEYRSLNEEKYEEAKVMLESATEQLNRVSDIYMSLMEIANSLTSVFLTAPYVSAEDGQAAECCKRAISLNFKEEPATEEEVFDAFAAFEGVPEELEAELLREEAFLEEFPVKDDLIGAMMQKVLYTRIRYAKQLHTTSLFVVLDEKFEETGFEEELEKFCSALSEKLDGGQKGINRARMAQVLYHLPVPFTRSSEVQSYILAAFENCHDMSEKQASRRILLEFMRER